MNENMTLRQWRRYVSRGCKTNQFDQKMLANLMHVSQQTVSAWENGTRALTKRDMMRLAQILGEDLTKLDMNQFKGVVAGVQTSF